MSPANLISQALLDDAIGYFQDPMPVNTFRVYYGFMPDKDSPDSIITVLDTQGVKQGRQMPGGKTIHKPGFQIIVRARDYTVAYDKAMAVWTWCDGVIKKTVVINSVSRIIASLTKVGSVLDMGVDDTNRRRLFSFNGFVTLGG